ncbi:MAG TPA: FG-GAP-like repeat-containing protein, partial [Terriglobia bacterium]|nr:FG-GAP-like repeat-containing protein [Terriglobia bacterium]
MRKILLRAFISGVLAWLAPSTLFAQASFHGIGDLPGGPVRSGVFDATKSGGVIYAVGGSAANDQTLCMSPGVPAGCVAQFNADTPILWSWDGVTTSLTALPNLATPSTPPANTAGAFAITRDAAYIAGQARSNASAPGQALPVRVTRSGLVNLNLAAAPFPVIPPSGVAQAISDDGLILYGWAGAPNRVFRFDVNATSSAMIPLLSVSDTGNLPAIRGASADGSVLVGVSFVAPYTGTNGRAFRYENAGGTVSAIPLLDGGTWNTALGVSSNGNIVLASGNSSANPNGEIYVYNVMTATTTALDSPIKPWSPSPSAGGITGDGAVAVATFVGDANHRQAYLHNSHGWFHLASAIAAQGIDILSDGWDVETIAVAGISPDGTLVFGSGEHNGNREGFVAEFPAGALAAFDVPAVPQTDPLIIGLWGISGDSGPEAVVFLADGTYFHLDAVHGSATPAEFTSGYERGRYHWEAGTNAFTFATLEDTNGSVGLSGANGFLGFTLAVTGNMISVGGEDVITRVTGSLSTVVGGWILGDPTIADNSQVLALFADGTFILARDGDYSMDPSGHDGLEAGTYTWSPDGTFTFNVTLDTNGAWGLVNGPSAGAITLELSLDGLHLTHSGTSDVFTRIVTTAPTPPVSNTRKDFNGDGRGDILWQHADGSAAIWLMNGSSPSAGGILIGGMTGWSVNKLGDFNGDGKADILWQHTDGSAAIWLMNGLSPISAGWLIGGGSGWSVSHVGDFNGDGKSDLLWSHTDGSAAIWLMDGVSQTGVVWLIGAGTGWSVRFLGDFNGDSKTDIVWENTDGSAAIWLMNGAGPIGAGGLIGPGTGWSVVHTADFNGDGRTDLVWENTDGSAAIWLMNGL